MSTLFYGIFINLTSSLIIHLIIGFHPGRETGTVAFVGEVQYAKGIFVGVVMDNPKAGKNNGG